MIVFKRLARTMSDARGESKSNPAFPSSSHPISQRSNGPSENSRQLRAYLSLPAFIASLGVGPKTLCKQ